MIVALTLASLLTAAEISPEGSAEVYSRRFVDGDADREGVEAELGARLRLEESDPHEARARLRMTYDNSVNELEWSLREAGLWIQIKEGHRLWLGQRSLIWGKADQVNAIDVANADDYRFFWLEEKAHRKRPRLFALYEWTSGDHKLEAFLTRYGRDGEHEFAEPTSPWCFRDCQSVTSEGIKNRLTLAGLSPQLTEPEAKSRYRLLEAGAKFSSRLGGLDYSLILHSGFEKYPIFKRIAFAAPSINYHRIFKRQYSAGGDFAYALGPVTFRAEGKATFNRLFYYRPSDPRFLTDVDGLQQTNDFEIVGGLDYFAPSNVFVNLQIYQWGHFGSHTGLMDSAARRLATWHLDRDLFIQDLNFSYEGIYDLINYSHWHRPKLSYAWNDSLSLSVGSSHFFGESDSLFGPMKDVIEAQAIFVF